MSDTVRAHLRAVLSRHPPWVVLLALAAECRLRADGWRQVREAKEALRWEREAHIYRTLGKRFQRQADKQYRQVLRVIRDRRRKEGERECDSCDRCKKWTDW